jgi:hypothetical protein
VVQDSTLLKDLGENLYKNKEIFIIYEEISHFFPVRRNIRLFRDSLMQQNITEAEKRFKQAKIECKCRDYIVLCLSYSI